MSYELWALRSLLWAHNQAAIERLCPRSIYLAGGMVRMDGPTEDVLSLYRADLGARSNPAP